MRGKASQLVELGDECADRGLADTLRAVPEQLASLSIEQRTFVDRATRDFSLPIRNSSGYTASDGSLGDLAHDRLLSEIFPEDEAGAATGTETTGT